MFVEQASFVNCFREGAAYKWPVFAYAVIVHGVADLRETCPGQRGEL